MASTIIHMCVANELNKKLKRNNKEILLGSVAPDISKIVGENKIKSHFENNDYSINLDKFLNKYKKQLDNDFLMGYYIHLYTDKLWAENFTSNLISNDCVKLLDGTQIILNKEELFYYIYNDYTNMNLSLIDFYNLDLSLFYEDVLIPNIEMDEIPINKLQLLIDKAGIIIENSKEEKKYIFDMYSVKDFISSCVNIIYKDIEKQGFI